MRLMAESIVVFSSTIAMTLIYLMLNRHKKTTHPSRRSLLQTSLPLLHTSDKDHDQGEIIGSSTPPHPFTWPPLAFFFLINIVHVVRLCLIMHDRYQQQKSFDWSSSEWEHNNTTRGSGRKMRLFFLLLLFCSNKCSMGKWHLLGGVGLISACDE